MAEIRELYKQTDVKIIYCPSHRYMYHIQQKLHEITNSEKENVMYVKTDREVINAYYMMASPPFSGDKWIAHIEYNSKVSPKCLDSIYTKVHPYGVFIVWVTEFRDLFRVQTKLYQKNFKDVIPLHKFNHLTYREMEEYFNGVDEEFRLTKALEDFVMDNYAWDVNAFTHLIAMLEGGTEFATEQHIMQKIGLGRKSVDSMLMRLMTSSASTKSGVKKLYSEMVFYTENLAIELEYTSIVNFMYASLKNLLDYKLYVLNGFQGTGIEEMPEKLNKYKRYAAKIEEQISLVDILNLQTTINKYRGREGKEALLMIFSAYLDYKYMKSGGDYGEAERAELQKQKKQRKKEEKEHQESLKSQKEW